MLPRNARKRSVTSSLFATEQKLPLIASPDASLVLTEHSPAEIWK